jgi:protein tyrosine phosphatase
MHLKAIFAAAISLAISTAAIAGDMKVSTLDTTNATRFTAAQVARVGWIDCRSILPAASTVTVLRTYSTGTDTVASVVCSAGLGRGGPNSTNWFAIYGEYLRCTGYTSGVVRVITLPN